MNPVDRMNFGFNDNESGVALLAGLMLLIAISLLALMAVSSMLLQQRMAGNFADSMRARHVAGVAVSAGEKHIYTMADSGRFPGCSSSCFGGLPAVPIYDPGSLPRHPEQLASDWWYDWGSTLTEVETSETISGLATLGLDPVYFLVEEIHFDADAGAAASPAAQPIDGVGYYRILGRASGLDENTIAVEESIFARPWNSSGLPMESPQSAADFCQAYLADYPCGRLAGRQRR